MLVALLLHPDVLLPGELVFVLRWLCQLTHYCFFLLLVALHVLLQEIHPLRVQGLDLELVHRAEGLEHQEGGVWGRNCEVMSGLGQLLKGKSTSWSNLLNFYFIRGDYGFIYFYLGYVWTRFSVRTGSSFSLANFDYIAEG